MQASIFDISNSQDFRETALEVFNFQYENVELYRNFVKNLQITPSQVKDIQDIPFLPIELFKKFEILAKNQAVEKKFISSGTSGTQTSIHYVASLSLYKHALFSGFERVFGSPDQYCIVGLLPSYLEREGSSLVFMMDQLITASKHPGSGFYLYNTQELYQLLQENESKKQKTILVGVTYALLDFAAEFPCPLRHTVVVETGGMKGRKKEMIREEVHDILKNAFGLQNIYSEYGMTELLSQAWSLGAGIFSTPSWMKILIRDPNDPQKYQPIGKTGAINIIDLANYYSCSFIATSDLGRKTTTGFEVLGRFDYSDIRGCSLLVI